MNPRRLTVYPRSIGNLVLKEVVEPQVGLDSALDDSADSIRDNLSPAIGILVGIGLSALLWGLITLFIYRSL